MNSANERLKWARINAGHSSAGDFAAAHGFPAVTYRAHESGVRNFKVQSAKAYAAALGLSYPAGWRWLMLGESQDAALMNAPLAAMDASDLATKQHGDANAATQTSPHFIELPVYDVAAAAGAGADPLDGPPTDQLVFSLSALRAISSAPTANLVGLFVRGDSMEPTLHHGDQILLDKSHQSPTHDAVYVVRLDNALMVKRLSIDPFRRLVSVISDNERYPVISDLGLDQVEVVGRVVWLGRRI